MNEKDFIVDDAFIWDKFNLSSLLEDVESNDFYTELEVREEISKRIDSINSLGFRLRLGQIAEIEIRDTTDITAGIQPIADHTYKFVIAKLVARKRNDKYLDTIIYHELCHVLQIEFLFNKGLFYYDENGKLRGLESERDYIESVYKVNGRHTAIWYQFVRKVNSNLFVNPPVAKELNHDDLVDIFLENFYKSDSFEVEDPDIYDYTNF